MTEEARITIRVKPDFKRSLESYARLRNMTVTDVLKTSVEHFVEDKLFKNKGIYSAKDELQDVMAWKKEDPEYFKKIYQRVEEDAKFASIEDQALLEIRKNLEQ